MKYLLFLAMLSLWLQCADTSQKGTETQPKINQTIDKGKNI
ncbi:MAG: hypothetical protein ACPGVB_00910 [Chitinophagales bacterium]